MYYLYSCLVVVRRIIIYISGSHIIISLHLSIDGLNMDRLRNDERFSRQRLDELTTAAQARLSPDRLERLHEEDYARFIVAREGNVTAALRQLTGAVEWAERIVDVQEELQCELCAQDPTSHSHVPLGTEDSEQSAIFYGCPARATNSAVDPIVHHVGRQLEYCFDLPHTGSRWVWCVDYNGFGLKEALQGKLAGKFGALFSNHMPERLHKILLLNPPSVFRILLQAAKPFVDQRTLDKLIPVTGSTKVVIQTLRDDHSFPPTVLAWLEQALAQKLPSTLPPLPQAARAMMLPSLAPGFNFAAAADDDDNDETARQLAARTMGQPLGGIGVRASLLLSGYLDAQTQIRVMS